MRNGISILFDDVKNFLSNEINRLTILLIAFIVICSVWQYKIHNDILNIQTIIESKSNKIEKKVDFRYFNISRSLEKIFEVSIDTKNGELK